MSKELVRNQKYWAIVFDFEFNNQNKICPAQHIRGFEMFRETLKRQYDFISDNILVSKDNRSSSVQTMLEFKKIHENFKPLFNVMKIQKVELVNIEMAGDIAELF